MALTFSISLIACGKKERLGLPKEQITTLACYDGQPKMSPDGKFIAYISTQTGDRHIWMVDMSDNIKTPLTMNEGADEGASFSPDNERIIFSSRINGQSDLWLMDQRQELVQITKTDSADEYSPAWSPDGQWIIFVKRGLTHRYEICRVNVKNSANVETLLQDSTELDTPSPSGNKIYFQRQEKNKFHIYRMSEAGKNVEPFTHSTSNEIHPSISPNGKWIAYVSDATGFYEVYISPLRHFEPRLAVNESMHHGRPSWSSDGRQILYETTPNWDIKIIDVKSQKDSVIVGDTMNDESPLITPDGRHLIFCSDRLGKKALFSLDLRNGSAAPLTNAQQNDCEPDISPDGKNIIFTSDRTGNKNIWIMKYAADSASTQFALALTNDTWNCYEPRFSKSGESIVYVSDKAGNADIWMMELKTRTEKQLTIDAHAELHPDFADGDRSILFQADWAYRWSIWRMPAEGGLPLPVTRDKLPYGRDTGPAVSPNGEIIAFTRSWYDDEDVWIMTASGGEKTTRTLSKDNTNQESHGRWSPDGKSVVFQVGHNTDIWMVDVSTMINE